MRKTTFSLLFWVFNNLRCLQDRNFAGSSRQTVIEMETPRRLHPEPLYQPSRAEHERLMLGEMTPSTSHQRCVLLLIGTHIE